MRVRVWGIGIVVGLGVFSAGFVAGYLFENDYLIPPRFRDVVWEDPPLPEGRWKTVRTAEIAALPDQDAIEALEAIGYVGAVNPSKIEDRGVTVFDAGRAQPGYNLYCSGHAPEAYLMDMQGRVVHEWRYELPLAWRAEEDPAEDVDGRAFWRRVRLLENGDLLAIFEGIGLIRVDKDSKLVWAQPCNAHHDLWVNADGTIEVLTRRAHTVDRLNADAPILEDYVSTFSADGELLNELSLLRCVETSAYAPMLDYVEPVGDILHTNTLAVLDGRHADELPAFRRGNVLVSFRNLNLVGVIDPGAQRLVWGVTGMWQLQHEPVLLDNGHILLFDNQGNQGFSKVIEFDPVTREVAWSYDTDLYSEALGAAYRLDNGDTLIVESNNGRVFEVTPEKETVWEFVNPHQFEPAPQLVPIIPDCVRLPVDVDLSWLDLRDDAGG